MIFNLDADMIMDSVVESLEAVSSQITETQLEKIADAVNDGLSGIIEVLTYGMQEHWKQEAKDSGTGWGQKYADAIKAEVTGMKGVVFVDKDIVDKTSNKPSMMYVNMVEQGMKSFSIKDALLRSEKAKISSTGIKYIVVPFPVATPRKPSQGKGASKFGGREMTEEAHKIVKGGGRYSGKLKGGKEVSGLVKYVTRQKHEQYGIFRMVSENSDGWIHPGRGASPVYPKVLQDVNKRVGQVIHEFCSAIVREYSS